MCGICGKLVFDPGGSVERSLIASMMDTIRHRGPDDDGIYTDGGVGLGHLRLSIIDLSTGHQPLSNEDGTVWIVFNGEIYNYQELREELLSKGHVFRTKSDTEVIVHLYEEYGEASVGKLRGMFAFAIWDSRQKVLLLARDRVGIKPLYYAQSKDGVVFGSEIKAIFADPAVRPAVEPDMIGRFLTFFFVPGTDTLFKGVQKLAPGHYLIARGSQVAVRQYWDLQFSETPIDLRDAEARTLELLEESLKLHMIADVPVGFLLSGGVDSTAMLAFAVGKTDYPLSTYTLGFSEAVEADERPYARLAAKRYGSQHHEMSMSADDFVSFMPRYVWHMEEPVCEPQAVALYYVTKMAREHVKVLISGEGGDEAFGGYPIYRNLLWLERLKTACWRARGLVGRGAMGINQVLHSQKVAKYGPLMDVPFDSYYYSRTSSPAKFFNQSGNGLYTKDFSNCIDSAKSSLFTRNLLSNGHGNLGLVNQMLYVDTKTSLPDDLLLKADKMTMANSLELRVPFLDHKLLEFAASLPANYKVRGWQTKYVAKRALRDMLPEEILKRKKVGFPVPYAAWLGGELKPWLSEILLDRQSLERGYFEKAALERLIAGHGQDGGVSKEVLSLATLELWHRAFSV